jgi:XTP/dITP diphosphohydrolase
MRPLVFATRNVGKVHELRILLGGLNRDIIDIAEAEARIARTIPETVEDAPTFAGNAAKKAREVAAATGWPALADDSGLEVDALGGAPGVFSARYAGNHGDDQGNNRKLLAALHGITDDKRSAQFHCVLAFADPAGMLGADVLEAEGVVRGAILDAGRGTGGFGYDPLFLCPELGMTFAESDRDAKSQVSHRGRAMAALEGRLRVYLAVAM